jgi:ketol-acid reductoisomerase
MTRVFHDTDAPLDAVTGKRIAIIGYGNQGRAWAQNLRDSGLDVRVGTMADSSRKEAEADGFHAHEIPDAVKDADVVCLLIPDEVMGEAVPSSITPVIEPGAAVCFASGYAVAFDEVMLPDGVDIVLVAPRMIGVGVRDSYESGEGFIAFVGVERDATGDAWPVTLGIAHGLGATRRGSVEMTCRQEALIDLFVEQAIAPALRKMWSDAAMVLLEAGIPLEAILVEFYLSGEIERTYRAMREMGPARQWQLHSQTSQYGSMSRAERFAAVDLLSGMRAAVEDISSGAFAREWAGVRADGYRRMKELRDGEGRDALMDFEDEVRKKFEPSPS